MKKTYLIIMLFGLLFQLLPVQAKTFYVTDKVLVGVYELASTESNLLKALPTGTPIEVIERQGEFAKIRSPDGTTGWVENSYLIDHKPAQLLVLDLTDQQKQMNEQLTLAQAELEATQKQLVEAKAKTATDSTEQSKKLTNEIKDLKSKSNNTNKQLAAVKKQLQNKSEQHTSLLKHNKELQQAVVDLRKNKKLTDKAKKEVTPATTKPSLTNNKQLQALQAQNKQLSATLKQVRDALSLPSNNSENAETEGVNLKFLWLLIAAFILAVSGFIGGVKWLDWRNLKRHGGFRI